MLEWAKRWLDKMDRAETPPDRSVQELLRLAAKTYERHHTGFMRPDEPFRIKVSKTELDSLKQHFAFANRHTLYPPHKGEASLYGVPLEVRE